MTTTPYVTVPREATEEIALKAVLRLAGEVCDALDNAEKRTENGEEVFIVFQPWGQQVEAALDALDDLPDDQPGYTMSPNAKATWALRRLLNAPASPPPQPDPDGDLGKVADEIAIRRFHRNNPRYASLKDAILTALTAAVASRDARIAKYQARLEIDHYFKLKPNLTDEQLDGPVDDTMERVEIPDAERDAMIDGISARDETIKLLDEDNDELVAEATRLRTALAEIKRLKSTPIGDSGFSVGPLALLQTAQRIATDALKVTSITGSAGGPIDAALAARPETPK